MRPFSTPLRRIVGVALSVVVLALCASVRIEREYTYGTESREYPIAWTTAVSGERTATVDVSLATAKDAFFLSVPRSFEAIGNEDILATWAIDGKTATSGIDTDGDERIELDTSYFLEPTFSRPTERVRVTLASTRSGVVLPSSVRLVALDSAAFARRASFDPAAVVRAVSKGLADSADIVSRGDWGANEEYRYADSTTWKPIFDKIASAGPSKPSAAELKNARIHEYLSKAFPDSYALASSSGSDRGRPLVWPVDKTARVEGIVVHHTAENNLGDLPDEALIRSIYYYHSVVRGWGDIGYNYVIGQRGKIYEGRAGGDYAVAAHALWNNRSTVGVSMIGNFQANNPNRDQDAGLQRIVSALADHYGIDTNKTMDAHKVCLANEDCLVKDYVAARIVGHRDVGYTTCPGDNLYVELGGVRAIENDLSAGRTLVENPEKGPDPDAPLFPIVSAEGAQTGTAPLSRGPTIRVKLSYPLQTAIVRAMSGSRLTLEYQGRKVALATGMSLTFGTDGDKIALYANGRTYALGGVPRLSSDVVTLAGWQRFPAWDTNKTNNDNKFRGTIELRAMSGSLVVINELPLEDYLYGLAEISNDAPPEKIKAILVSARSYGYFYAQPENRKFPGKPYDASDDPNVFQKYLGYGFESRSTVVKNLVDATRGEVLTHSGVPIKPWYFTQSDGRTLSYLEYCRSTLNPTRPETCQDIPYLQSVPDPGSAGKTRLGHGVGMSGAGAQYLAVDQRMTYDAILKYFYHGVELKTVY